MEVDINIYICRHAYRKLNRTIDCLAKKGIGILESSVWRSNFPKDLINVSFKDYCGPFSNCVCKISIMKSSFIKKKKNSFNDTPNSIVCPGQFAPISTNPMRLKS